MKFKKALAVFAAASMLAGCIPVMAETFDEPTRRYIYSNDFETEKPAWNAVTTSLEEDPSDGSNHVLKISQTKGTIKYYTIGYASNVYDFSKKWTMYGVDGSKKTVTQADMYLPWSLLSELGDTGVFEVAVPISDDAWTHDSTGKMTITKTQGSDNFTLTQGKNSMTVEPDTWFNIKYIFQLLDTYTSGSAPVSIYINNELFASTSVSIWWKDGVNPGFTSAQSVKGLTFTPKVDINNGYYLDNVSIYEYVDQELNLSVSDGETGVAGDSKFTASCNADINAKDFEGKITAEDSQGNSFIADVTQEDEKTIGFMFYGLADETEYTLKIGDVISGEASIIGKQIKFTTKAAEFMFVNADLPDGAEIEPGDYTINLSFSQKLSAEELEKCMSVEDEDGKEITYTLQQSSETKISAALTNLEELTGYTLKIGSALESINGLPLSAEFNLNFRTSQKPDEPIIDPYDPAASNDKIILTQQDLEAGPWYVSNSSVGSVSVENDGDSNYIRFHLNDKTEERVNFYPKAKDKYTEIESKSAKYLLDNMLVFEYEVKYPNISKLSRSDIRFSMHPNNESISEDKDTGTWTPTLSNNYTESTGLRILKESVSKTAVTVKKTEEIDDEWIKIKSVIDTKTGAVWVYMPDGTTNKTSLNMHDSPSWGADDKYLDWGTYMYTKQIIMGLTAVDNTGADMYIRNFSAKRITNTLSVVNANFNYGDYYVDSSNIQLEFNDDVDLSAFDGCVYITDTDGNRVDCDLNVSGEDKSFTVSALGLKPYTQYYLNIEGLRAKSLRAMSEKFERLFTTKKSSKIFVDTQDKNAVLNTYGKKLSKADKLDYTVVLKSEDSSTADILGAVAVYGENDKLLSIKYNNLQLGENEFKLTDIPNGAVSVKIYAWNIKDGKISGLLHEPDSLQESVKSEYTLDKSKTLPQFKTAIADNTKSVIGISGKTEDSDGIYTIAVLDGKDTPITEIQNKTLALTYANVNNGEFSSSAVLDYPSGTYTVYVITDSGAYSDNFEYIRLDDLVENYIKKIADGTIAQNQIYSKTAEYNAGIGIDLNTEFVSERDKALFNKRMYEKRTLLTGASNEEYARQLQNNIQFARDEINYLNELSSITYYGLIKDKLADGVKFTDIDFTQYSALDNSKQSTVQSAFIGKTFADGDEVKTFFDKQVKEAKNGGTQYGGGNSGSTSGGTGGGSNLNTIINNDKRETTADDVFSDLGNYSWAKEAILNLAKRGIINGVEKNKFAPDGLVTREQFVKMAVLAMDIHNEKGIADFDDVAPGAWYGSYIASAKQKNIINGISDTDFGVGSNITREDVAVIIYRMFEQKGIKLMNTKSDFDDMSGISDYAYAAVSALAGEGIINGTGENKFSPKNNTTRAEAAVLINAFMKGVK